MTKPQTAGDRWLAEIEDAYVLNESERLTAEIVARCKDTIDSLPETAFREVRAQQTIMLRALSQLALPEAAGGPVSLSASQKGRRAANARWAAARNAGAAGGET